jgi:hypothetical protein
MQADGIEIKFMQQRKSHFHGEKFQSSLIIIINATELLLLFFIFVAFGGLIFFSKSD